jgi:hypothetical protein|tara:strand:+ start:24 stop:203 length:180 start_codon:yes stop_codon:yes gene_type:complete
MSRVSKKRLLEILKGEEDFKTNIWDWFSKPVTQEQWLKEYKRWKKDQEKTLVKNKRTNS